jgi:hypothetical protein
MAYARIEKAADKRHNTNGPGLTWVYLEHWEDLDKDDDELHQERQSQFTAECAALTPEDFQKFHEKITLPKVTKEELYELVRPEYHHLIDLWDLKEAETLPTSKPGVDHGI